MASTWSGSTWLCGAALLVAGVLSANPLFAAERNACGCYQTGAGACVCDRNAKCGCPGLCEPQGCEARREKALQKEIESETKKAREADKQRAASEHEAAPKAPETLSPRPARGLPPAQVKQLIKLLDRYFAEHPRARAQTAGNLRDEILRSP
jgi:hypothetical protein